MLYRSIAAGLGLLILVTLPGALAGDAPETVDLTLPKGDPDAGLEAFVELGCPSCHRVAGEEELPLRVSANPGPTLGRYHAGQEAARLGLSIFAPSHEISATVRDREDNLSPMPDFSDAMTVRQFLDLIAYLQSL
jgi:mono/diheme cytochrome c family protein